MFTEEDLKQALSLIEKCQKDREEINGQKLTKFQARNFLVYTNQLTKAQFESLLFTWGE